MSSGAPLFRSQTVVSTGPVPDKTDSCQTCALSLVVAPTAPANPFPRTNLAPGYVAVGGIPGSGGGFQQLGYGVLVVYLFLIYSRIFDVKFASLHIPGISFRIILVMMLASQSFVVALEDRYWPRNDLHVRMVRLRDSIQ